MGDEALPESVDIAVKDIDQLLIELRDEVSRLEAARSALTRRRRPPGRRRATQNRAARPRSARGRGTTRITQTLELVGKQPGVTIPQLAEAMKIQPNYLYRVLPRLASEGKVRREGQGWHPTELASVASAALD